MNLWWSSLRKQPTFHDAITSAEIPYWWCVTTQILVVLLINLSCSTTNQKHYPELDSDASSVCRFCARFAEAISRGNQWRFHELSAFLSGLSGGVLCKFPIFSVWQLRAAIAPCIESVFLLDRLCYLHEKVLFYIRHLDSLYLFMSWHNVFFNEILLRFFVNTNFEIISLHSYFVCLHLLCVYFSVRITTLYM